MIGEQIFSIRGETTNGLKLSLEPHSMFYCKLALYGLNTGLLQGQMMNLDIAKDEVMRKVGRNLLLFQLLENALKYLVMNGELSGYFSELQSNQLKRSERVGKQTLGLVAGQFFDQNFRTNKDGGQLPEQISEPHLKIKIEFDVENDNFEVREKALSQLIAGRNELVHHFLKRIEQDYLESWIEASGYLDDQREQIIQELDYYRTHVASVKGLMKKISDFLSSEEGKKLFLS